jgi:hypothetical protein
VEQRGVEVHEEDRAMKNLITQHSESKTEEIIGVLWFILAALLDASDHPHWALFCWGKGALDMVYAFVVALTEIRDERRAKLTAIGMANAHKFDPPKDDTTFSC